MWQKIKKLLVLGLELGSYKKTCKHDKQNLKRVNAIIGGQTKVITDEI